MIKWIYPVLVDNDNATISKENVSEDMRSYVNALVDNIECSKRQTEYRLARETTEVSQIVLNSVCGDCILDENTSKKCNSIAERFLRYEYEAKEKIEKMKLTIHNGCLIQALIKVSDNQYKYVIAKGDWSDFLNKNNFSKAEGIYINKKNLGKSCIFYITIENSIAKITDCKVLLDNPASYFWDKFLELEKSLNDDDCTRNMVKKVTNLIDDTFRHQYPRHRQYLRNTFITYLYSNDLIDFEDIKQTIFMPYLSNSDIEQQVQDKFFETLEKLPERGKDKFGRQFTCVRKKIEAKIIKSKYVLDEHVFLEIQDNYSEGEISRIVSGKDDNQKKYLKIYTDNEEALKTFNEESLDGE